ncbi:hypothetical protein AMK59_3393, partial [Oryctes borbonicus]
MSGKGTFQPDSDVHITYEDQQKINKFARLNAKWEDLKDEVKSKENLEEACDEIALFDDDEKIPYLVGEVFIYQNKETTDQCLEEAKRNTENEISDLKSQIGKLRDMMDDLKSHLYGKFGSHINL